MNQRKFAAELNEFVGWLLVKKGISRQHRRSWFQNTIGLDGKYLSRWLGKTIPGETSWSQFQRKLDQTYPDLPGLNERLHVLTEKLEQVRSERFEMEKSRPPRDSSQSGITMYFGDFVDIVEPWKNLFRESNHLDLLVMYASTWRNTYLQYAREMLLKPRSRLRVVLPQFSQLLQLYSARLDIATELLESRITDAFEEFKSLSRHGQVEIYTTNVYLNHALYLYDKAGVLALYSFRTDRCATPAVLMETGNLLDFARRDFEWIVSPKNRQTKLAYRSRSKM